VQEVGETNQGQHLRIVLEFTRDEVLAALELGLRQVGVQACETQRA
jgi:hypothetical protein